MILVIISRDIIVTLFRFLLMNKNIIMKTSKYAKAKTLILIILVHIILILHTFSPDYISSIKIFNLNFIYLSMLLCVFYTLFTGYDYVIRNIRNIND